MKISDYIVEYLISKKITDVFGYPGGMVTYLMESFSKHEKKIKAHINYHEQASSFCACGYGSVSHKPGIAYATSGPGATNLITGIANAYFDSIPTIFITGQVNINEGKGKLKVRQKGFQETDIISIVKPITKYAVSVNNKNKIKYYLDKAFFEATSGRPGPVLLDIPMNIFKEEINPTKLKSYHIPLENQDALDINEIIKLIKKAKRPCIIAGSGIKISNSVQLFKKCIEKLKIPVVTSMISTDILDNNCQYNYGFLGAYGNRTANFIVEKSDLIISLGARLDIRQIGATKTFFAPTAKLIRVDIDEFELSNKIKEDEIQIHTDVKLFLSEISNAFFNEKKGEWLDICKIIKSKLYAIDYLEPNKFINKMSDVIDDNVVITTDVGQNQVWIAQSFDFKPHQSCLFSGGHGAMGFSLPAAIGAYYATKKRVICFTGDGGFQMNIQELQFIAREQLPITIILMNNKSLGMIRHFQEMYFNSNYYQTTKNGGYTVPDFEQIAGAYKISYKKINNFHEINSLLFGYTPKIIEINLSNTTYVNPKLKFGSPNNDQEPLLDRELFNYLQNL